jgi:hypothetical protein
MVSTVLSKKQFTYVSIKRDADLLHELTMISLNHAKTIFFPIMNLQDVKNIKDLVDDKWYKALKSEVQSEIQGYGIPHFGICNWNKREFHNVTCIEHFADDIFNILSDDGKVTTNDFCGIITYSKK